MSDRIKELIFSFAFADAAGRERASAELARFGAEALPRLIAALEHPDDAVRGHAALTLGYMKAAAAAGPLAKLVDDAATSDRVRGLAMRALADVADPGGANLLFAVAAKRRQDRDLFVRALACTVLGKLGDARGKPLLESSLKDPEPWVREAAHKALAELRAVVPAQPAPPPEPVPTAAVLASAVVRTGTETFAAPLEADPTRLAMAKLRAREQTTREEGLGELIQLGPRAVPSLLQAIYDSQVATATAAAQALGRIGDRRGLRGLTDLLISPATGDTLRAVALHAVASLLETPPPSATGPQASETTPPPTPPELLAALVEHARHADRFVRAAAVAALARHGGPAARNAVSAALDDADAWVREAAATGAARTLGPEDSVSLPRLIEALSTSLEPRIQAKLLRAVARVTSRATMADRAAIGPATHFLSSSDPGVRVEALDVLGRFLGPQAEPQALEAVIRSLSDPDPTVRRLALSLAAERLPLGHAAAMGPVLAQLDRQAPEVTRLVALALARIGDEPAIDTLIELSTDPDAFTSQSARQALGRIPRESPVQVRLDEQGHFQKHLAYRCQCGGLLAFVTTPEDREELRCPDCGTDHVVSPTGQLLRISDAPLGTCRCQSCKRRSLLIHGTGEWATFLVCSRTGIAHVRPFDRPSEIRRLDQLEVGACRCCSEAQPLEREAARGATASAGERPAPPAAGAERGDVAASPPATGSVRPGDQVVCHRTRRPHVLVDGRWLPASGAATTDVAAINRALIAGSMALTQSGLPIDEDPR